MADQAQPEDNPGSEKHASGSKLSDEQSRKLDFFTSAPLRSANRLMEKLYKDESFYQTATYAWVGEGDAKKLFLYGVCKEVMKSAIGLISDKEILQEVPSGDPDRFAKIVNGALTDAQTYRIRKLVELLILLVLFDRNTKRDEEYRVFLFAENLDLALTRQQDFQDLYEGRTISNTQHSIDDYAERIRRDMEHLGMTEIWFLDANRLSKRRPSVFRSRKRLFLDALSVATSDERLALGISYGRGYSRASQSIHPLLGSHDSGPRENNINRIFGQFAQQSIIAMHVMHLAYKLAGIDDPDGLAKIMGENFERSGASKAVADLKKDFEIGDLVLTAWSDLAEIVDSHTSKYGYKAYRIRYLSRPPLSEFPEDWIESQNIAARLMTKGSVRPFYERHTHYQKLPKEVADTMKKVMGQSDDELLKYAKGFFVAMHKHGLLIPMLLESGFLKKRDAQSF